MYYPDGHLSVHSPVYDEVIGNANNFWSHTEFILFQLINQNSRKASQNGNVGMDTPLVDDEGYPRSDIDVALIRITRNNIHCLNTDQKQIMLELESVLHEIHEYARQNPFENVLTDGNACSSENKLSEDQSTQIVKKPFLKIDQISPNSIAEQADLKVGDRIVQFGSVSADNFNSLQDISTVFRNTSPGVS
ncbi:26S proteasome non-ATPase regulatory subunit 9, variant 2 [Schistosoma haematobium]|uniref:26S proteasome non-ATPase regulatory subunit 9, variant 2 n=1 Tax=Schistosoma haematobium TaxID=6185 RepID=A0A922LJV9_SCHHA|nr:26S proteasome non-ATPase regulatory subunit 9, variant 2 [Schistosoma haematobium]KAH9587591.1 26S proteasome non-ATPase regulatory subunit 9, variant 2 [Schistosoma haematobium]